MEPLNICLIQSDLVWENASANLENFESKILSQKDKAVDVFILPEMFATGFSMKASELAEDMKGPSIKKMKEWAAESKACITGSLIIEEEDLYYNRLIWIFPNGDLKYYDKRHLFTLAGEQNSFRAGDKNITIEYKGWRIRPLICYDLRFPVWSRNADDYDLLIYVANWPNMRTYAWDQLLIARAIENQAYVAGVNRVGHDGKQVYFLGHTALIDPMGEKVSSLKPEEEGMEICTLSAKRLKETRQKLAFLNDRDEFMIL